jgi:hypothetical protein
MATAYTSLLGLALPVTGELSGTWGATVNDEITALLDSAVAGTTSITADADITLSDTDGAANETRQAVILWNPATGTTTRNITAPARSKAYIVINASGGTQSIVLRGAGPTTGVTIVKGESAVCAWNGSDFVKVANQNGIGNFTTVDTTNLEVTNLKALDGTAAGSIANSTGVVTLASSVLTTTDINGGTIDGTAIGGASAAAGAFTTLSATGVTTVQAGTAAAPAITTTGDTNTGIFFPAADTIAFAEGGVESMRIDSDGDVGIGTSSPAFRLDVAGGAGRIIPSGGSPNTPEAGAGTLNVYGATSSITTRTGALRLESYSTLAANVGTGVSFSGRFNTAPSDSSYTFAKIGGYKENATSGNGAGYLAFATTTGAGDLTERARIDSSGNVGIGTSSPTSYAGSSTNKTLQIYNSASANAEIRLSNATTGTGATVGTLIQQAGNDMYVWNASNSFMSFGTNASERMRIDSSGNVGIGTSSPGQKLEVYNAGGGPTIRVTSADTGTGSGNGFSIGLDNTGAAYLTQNENQPLILLTNATERARIDSSGNLLVGTTGQIGAERLGVEQTSTTGQAVYCYAANASYAGNVIVVNTARAASTAFTSIATYSQGVNQFYVGGTGLIYSVQLDGGATTLSVNAAGQIIRTPSDASLKTNIQPITYGLDTVMKLKPIKHEWVEEINMGAPSIGFIAQDMELEVPEVVSGEEYKSIDYPKLTAVLTKAIQEQQALITTLTDRITALEAK